MVGADRHSSRDGVDLVPPVNLTLSLELVEESGWGRVRMPSDDLWTHTSLLTTDTDGSFGAGPLSAPRASWRIVSARPTGSRPMRR